MRPGAAATTSPGAPLAGFTTGASGWSAGPRWAQVPSPRWAAAHQRAEVELELTKLRASTEAAVARFNAAQGPLADAITMLGNQQVLAKVAEAVSAQRLFGGKDVSQVVGNLFTGTRLAGVFAKVERGAIPDSEE